MSDYLASWHERRDGQMAAVPAAEGAEAAPRKWLSNYSGSSVHAFEASQDLALVDRSWTGRLELVGEDRHRFLNGLVTCDTSEESLTAGTVRSGFFTDGRGRVLADVLVLALPDRIWLELPAGRQKHVREHLVKYIVADRVDVRPLSDFVTVALLGERVAERLVSAYGSGLGDLTVAATVQLGKTQVLCHPHPKLGVAAVQLWVSSGIAEPLLEELTVALDPLVLLGNRDVDALRAWAGVPFWGLDFDQRNLPGEVAVPSAIDYDKGCYLGQEVVARMHYRGRPARELRRVAGQGPVPAAASDLFLENADDPSGDRRSIGRITSSAPARDGASWQGLALLAKAALDAATVALADGEVVRVVGVPEA